MEGAASAGRPETAMEALARSANKAPEPAGGLVGIGDIPPQPNGDSLRLRVKMLEQENADLHLKLGAAMQEVDDRLSRLEKAIG